MPMIMSLTIQYTDVIEHQWEDMYDSDSGIVKPDLDWNTDGYSASHHSPWIITVLEPDFWGFWQND